MARLGDHPNIVTVFDAVVRRGRAAHRRPLHGRRLAGRAARRRAGRAARARRGAAHRPLARRRARPRPRARGRPPRRQARQRLARRRRQRRASATSASRWPPATRPRPPPRHRDALLPGARAGRRHRAAAAVRPLRARRDAVGAAVRAPAVHRPRRDLAARAAPPRGARSALAPRARHRARARRARARAAGQAPGGPARRTPPPCATRSTGWAAPRASPPPRSRRTATRSSGATRSWRSCAARSARPSRGGAGVVAIAGEPGIGKTRLVDEAVAESAARGAAVVRGRADEESRAYGPWRAALRPLVAAASGLPAAVLDDVRRLTGDGRPPELPAAGEPADAGGEEERLRMFDAVAERSSAPRRASGWSASRSRTSTPPTAPRSRCSATSRRGLSGRAAARPADVPRGGRRRRPSAGRRPRRARARPLG